MITAPTDPAGRLTTRDDQGLTTHVLTVGDGPDAALAELVPERGGLLARLRVRGQELLYLDPKTLHDRSQNVRGGVPVLFPIAGRLEGEGYEWDGRRYELKQHGFARRRPFRVVGSHASAGQASVTVALSADDQTRAVFPFDFDLQLGFRLDAAGVTIESCCRNTGATELPFHLGFHPYFPVLDGDKAALRVESSASLAFDNVTRRRGPAPARISFDVPELDLHLLDHPGGRARIERPGGAPVELEFDPPFSVLVLWTVRGKDFVCVEPWTAPGGALQTGERLLRIPPAAALSTRFRIGLGPAPANVR